mmetsp:Transcript_1793/g.3243  ORF Transcript_1793/g.3243 Transcript_1793/m.3243 type:complete len:190 (+) Transcript_1793:181-750(+)|eukprot:CAMPEP_0176497524 /NCGR_PEP_ID=MMETSP0200_2-20121128/11768_1 /TAXON_ID=947934 /ORGANISM="Chaetoceros sp., Strain GSL56" /LENGTH=189 /DNA_ID=CAMNT_0017895539 /DNA_START=102 /DNA_END=671 /DNA_ORIENTATION=+
MKTLTLLLQLTCLLSTCVVVTTASAAPDNFLLTFDQDLHTFGARRKKNKCKEVVVSKANVSPQVVKHNIKPPQDFFDDYDLAEQDIFQHVENAEKTVLTAAGHLIRDEVNYLFSDHHKKVDEMKNDDGDDQNVQQQQRGGRRRGSNVPSKDKKKVKGVNAKKEGELTEHEKRHAWFEQVLKDYIDNDLE